MEAALLEAVLAAPEQLEPRLIYGDYLLELGLPRGELVSLQCRLAASPDSPDRAALEARIEALYEEHGRGWLAAVGVGFLPPGLPNPFERGFLHRVEMTGTQFDGCHRALLSREPVRRLELRVSIPRAFAEPELGLGCVTQVVIHDANDDAVARLAHAPCLAHLQSMRLRGPMTDQGALAIASSPHLRALEELVLERPRLTQMGIADLARGYRERLRIDDNQAEPFELGIFNPPPPFDWGEPSDPNE